ncbi:hypothetical protein ACLB2K_040858 [Fragaria x ananassa]
MANYHEFRALYSLSYSKKQNYGGYVLFAARDYLSPITDLPTSVNNNWSLNVVLFGGRWLRNCPIYVVPIGLPKILKHKPRPSHPCDMDLDFDLLSDLLEVGKVAACTEMNVEDSTARISEDAILLEIPDEGYGKPPIDIEVPGKTRDMVNVNLGEKRK